MKIKIALAALMSVVVMLGCGAVAFAEYDLTVEEAKQYFAIIAELDVETIENGYTFTKNGGTVTATMNADPTQTVDFWYDEEGVIQYNGFFGSSAEHDDEVSMTSAELKDVIANLKQGTGGVYSMAVQGFDFVVGNPLGVMMVCISFAGAGIGLVGRAFKTARK